MRIENMKKRRLALNGFNKNMNNRSKREWNGVF